MRYLAFVALALLLLCPFASASFDFLYMTNGTNAADPDDYYAFAQPSSLYLMGDILYVADGGNSLVYALNASDGLSRIKTASSPSSEPYLSNPMHMAFDSYSSLLYIAGGSSGNILYYTGQGSMVDKWNNGATNVQRASGLAFSNSTIYVTDASRGQLVAFSRTTKAFSSTILQSGGSDGQLTSPQDIIFQGGLVYISDSAKGLIFVYDRNFTFLYTMGRGKGGVSLASPRGMDFSDNRLYVADASLKSVVAFSLDGYPVDVLNSSTAGGNLSYPEDVVAANGTLYVADTQNRLVKAFSITKTGGDPVILQLISDANASCISLRTMQSVAARLNVSFTPDSVSDTLVSAARQYYDAFAFSSASSIAQNAKSSCTSAQSALTQSVELRVKYLIQSSQATVAPYRALPATNASYVVQFDNKAAAASSALASKNYAAATDLALSLPSLADSIVTGSESRAAVEEERKQNQSTALLASEMTSLSSRIAALQAKSDAYRQGINLSGSHGLLALAQKSADAGDFAAANHSLGLAGLEITAYEATLGASIKDIDAAIASLAISEIELNASAGRSMLFAPDLAKERALMAQARETVYSSPSSALQMASQAKAAAESKSRDSQALSLAAASVAVVLFFIALIAAGFLFHILGKKKQGM
ncbi:MAG: NHL repeat-containing protein [Candidatus Micrarchaeia archaeon]